MNNFINSCKLISPLSDELSEVISQRLKIINASKGTEICKQGHVNMSLYHINNGIVKHFYIRNNKPLILQFFVESNFFMVLDSFLSHTPSEFSTVAIEETEISYLSYSDIEYLASKYHQFETLLRKLISKATLGTYSRFKEIFEQDATSLYNTFLQNNPNLINRLSLGDLAAYFGISQVSLSRIRSKK